MSLDEDALADHQRPLHGKLEVAPAKPCRTQHDLANRVPHRLVPRPNPGRR